MDSTTYADYTGDAEHAHQFLAPAVLAALPPPPARIFDLGCGNGSFAADLTTRGYTVTGVDPSAPGIAYATQRWPGLDVHQGSAYDDLVSRYGRFPFVVSLEVVEHVYAPRDYARTLFDLLDPGGTAIVSTPYHGYLKNLAIAVAGGFDKHATALWDHGHIKFWSMETLGQLLREAGFGTIEWRRVGRIPALARSMVAIARKP
jgi:2-polyprenyl-6-hydroxyphenyl methylase/3-demethylubiquinone-9 3-methyltransferase